MKICPILIAFLFTIGAVFAGAANINGENNQPNNMEKFCAENFRLVTNTNISPRERITAIHRMDRSGSIYWHKQLVDYFRSNIIRMTNLTFITYEPYPGLYTTTITGPGPSDKLTGPQTNISPITKSVLVTNIFNLEVHLAKSLGRFITEEAVDVFLDIVADNNIAPDLRLEAIMQIARYVKTSLPNTGNEYSFYHKGDGHMVLDVSSTNRNMATARFVSDHQVAIKRLPTIRQRLISMTGGSANDVKYAFVLEKNAGDSVERRIEMIMQDIQTMEKESSK